MQMVIASLTEKEGEDVAHENLTCLPTDISWRNKSSSWITQNDKIKD